MKLLAEGEEKIEEDYNVKKMIKKIKKLEFQVKILKEAS